MNKNAEQVARALGEATRGSDGWWNCKCPAHKDGKPSLERNPIGLDRSQRR